MLIELFRRACKAPVTEVIHLTTIHFSRSIHKLLILQMREFEVRTELKQLTVRIAPTGADLCGWGEYPQPPGHRIRRQVRKIFAVKF